MAELLISLAILGTLATFTIPPLFTTSPTGPNAQYTQSARNVAFMIVAAYEQYKMGNPSPPTTMRAVDLTPYMNYVAQLPTTKKLDAHANSGGTPSNCAGVGIGQQGICLSLHNGGALWADTNSRFGGTTSLSVVYFRFDPNATYEGSGVQDAPGMALQIALYYDGVVKTRGTLRPNSTYYAPGTGAKTESSTGNEDPAWFQGFS